MALVVSVTRRVVVIEVTQTTVAVQKALPIASYLRFAGSVYYTLNFDTVNIRVDKIEHSYTSSGSLQVVLWAVEDYEGGSDWTGTRMAVVQLESCDKGECYENVDQTVARTSPAPGQYTMIMSLEAYTEGDYVQYDYRAFDEGQSITGQAKFAGSIGYTLNGSTVELRTDRISHNFTSKTGSLKIVLWACEDIGDSGSWTGYSVAEYQLDPLELKYTYDDLALTVTAAKPPSGWYPMIMQLQSYEGSGWVGQDYRVFDEPEGF